MGRSWERLVPADIMTPSIAPVSSTRDGDPLSQCAGHGGWLSQHGLGPDPGRGRDRDGESGVQTRENGVRPVCLGTDPTTEEQERRGKPVALSWELLCLLGAQVQECHPPVTTLLPTWARARGEVPAAWPGPCALRTRPTAPPAGLRPAPPPLHTTASWKGFLTLAGGSF